MTSNPKPRVRRTAHNVQCSFLLPHRVHHVTSYPILSPQGATIIIYAHDNGITLLWRGGRRLMPRKDSSSSEIKNGTNGPPNGVPSEDAVMILDSDDDSPLVAPTRASSYIDKPSFEDSSSQSHESPDIIQTLHLVFGSPIHHIAALPVTPCPAEDAPYAGADILKEKMLFAVSSSSSEVYLVLLPLTPPSNESKAREELRSSLAAPLAGNGTWGEQVFTLGGQSQPSDGLALNLVKTKPTGKTESFSSPLPKVVVASHSREASGTLRLWEIGLDEKPKPQSHPRQPFQTEYIPSHLTGISFNPTHSTQILTSVSPHAVRIYDFAKPSFPDDETPGSFPSQGSWLLSLYPPFQRQSSRRKPVLATAWVSRGKAILALLADGQWGIWDIEGANSSGTTLFGKQSTGIKGAALTNFSITGYVEGTSGLRNPTSQKQPASGGDFVPMTPHTRKEAMLSSSGHERLFAIQGGIAVAPLPSRGAATGDESVVMWLGGSEHVVVIPGIAAFWASQERRGKSDGGGVNLFSGTTPTRMVRLDTLVAGLMGERCNGVETIVRLENGGPSRDVEQGVPIDIIIRGEHRLVIVRMGERGPGTKIGGVVGWKRKLGEHTKAFEPTSAIFVHPRPEKPSSIAFNLSVGGSLRAASARAGEAVQDSYQLPEPPQSKPRILPRPRSSGLTFVDQISKAADADEVDGEERNVEEEMLDIMEIDRELENMEDERLQGRKKVFFEEGFDDDAF
ncbi:hypothetical protein MKZ38_005421 [Zalerion maritima]|uniref:Nucleoporin NUP37 n=1 Tax=Zalerion maritima TaxID=339359 RepID=A0AAD5RK84_9PEZI|nr:hypothetical protein MKZ38_005421 [Zalerion maritima]